MRSADILVGEVYTAMVSDRVVPVRVDGYRCKTYDPKPPVRYGYTSQKYWPCTNLKTGRAIVVKSAQRFREHVPASEVAARLEVLV